MAPPISWPASLVLVGLGGCLLAVLAGALAPVALADPLLDRLLEKGLADLKGAEQTYAAGDLEQSRHLAERAERIFREAYDLDPSNLSTLRLGGTASVFAGNAKRATWWAEAYAGRTPYGAEDPDLHYLRGLTALRAYDDPSAAIRHLMRMQAANPAVRPQERDLLLYEALHRHGAQLLANQMPEMAARQFLTAVLVAQRLGHKAKLDAARTNYARALDAGNRKLEAEAIFRALRDEHPTNPIWHLHLGLCLGDQNRFQEAVQCYASVIRLYEPGSAPPEVDRDLLRAWLRLGNCYRILAAPSRDDATRQRLLNEALSALRHYVKVQPQEPLGWKWLGTILFEDFERPYEAEPYLRKAFEMDPLCAAPLALLIQIHEHYPPPPEQGEGEAALQAWRSPLEEWNRVLTQEAEARNKALEKRKRQNGTDGCS